MNKETDGHDELDEPVEKRLSYRFGFVPRAGGFKVLCPPVQAYGDGVMGYFDEHGREYEVVQKEHLETCFFAPNTELMEVGKTYVTELPDDLYRTEFLDLNPFDIQALLRFQQKYGIIKGARAQKHYIARDDRRLLRPEPDGTAFAGSWTETYSDQLSGIAASAALYDTVPMDEYVDVRVLARLGAVSFLETVSTVYDAQRIIRETLRILRDDLPPVTKREAALAKMSSEWLAALLPQKAPVVELVYEGMNDDLPMGLMEAIHLQLARGLLSNGAYRACANPECGKLFTPAETGRRLDTKYCCSECQERAKRLRYVAKHARGR